MAVPLGTVGCLIHTQRHTDIAVVSVIFRGLAGEIRQQRPINDCCIEKLGDYILDKPMR